MKSPNNTTSLKRRKVLYLKYLWNFTGYMALFAVLFKILLKMKNVSHDICLPGTVSYPVKYEKYFLI